MAIVQSLEARERALDAIGFRDVRKLERAGVRFTLSTAPQYGAYQRRRAPVKVLAFSFLAIVVIVAAIYAVRLAIATSQFLRS